MWHISTVPLLHGIERLQARHDLAGGKGLDLEFVVGGFRHVFGECLAPRHRCVSSDFGKLDVSRHFSSGIDCAMAGAAIVLAGKADAGRFQEFATFHGVVSLCGPHDGAARWRNPDAKWEFRAGRIEKRRADGAPPICLRLDHDFVAPRADRAEADRGRGRRSRDRFSHAGCRAASPRPAGRRREVSRIAMSSGTSPRNGTPSRSASLCAPP